MTNHQSKYPLLPYSQLVYESTRWMPRVYWFEMKWRWPNGAAQEERLCEAVRVAFNNHPIFRARIDKQGMQWDSQTDDILHGQYHDVQLWKSGNDVYGHAKWSRILGDARSEQIVFEDFFRAYRGESLETDDYWRYVEFYEQHKSTRHYVDSEVWLKQEFANESVPVRPTTDRRWLTTILPMKPGLLVADYSDLQLQIRSITTNGYLPVDGIFSLCASLAIAEYCGTDEAALTWAYEGRERPEEQRIIGSLHRDVPFHIRKSRIENRESAIREARNQMRAGIAHSDFPYTLTAPYNKRWNYAVNVLHMRNYEKIEKSIPFPIEVIPASPQKYAYALLDVEIHEREDSLQLVYRYSATHYKPESIRKFAALVRKYVEWLID